MKKILGVLLAVVMMFGVFALVACEPTATDPYEAIPDNMTSADGKYELAVVTDVGALKDKGFNQGTFEGVKKYGHDNGISYKYYQPANGNSATDADRIDAMNLAIRNGAKVIVAPGFLQATAMRTVAKANPTVKFVFIDGWPLTDAVDENGAEAGELLTNVVAVTYKEQESGYFAGYAAVMEGYTKLGFTGGGGGSNPAVNRFGYGYIQGAEAAAKEKGVEVEIKYSYKFGGTFSASTDLQAQISGWYNAGTEVVFSCGGSMFSSVTAAAEGTKDGKIIGVDVDQSASSDRVITSAVKGLRESVEIILSKYYDNKWDSELAGKGVTLGATDNATGLPTATWSMKNFTLEQYNTLFESVKNGTVSIASEVPANVDGTWLASLELTKVTISYEA